MSQQQTLPEEPTRSTTPRGRLARLVTEVLAPAPLAAFLLALVAIHSAPSTPRGLLSAVTAVLFGSLIPLWYLMRGVRAGRWDNHHVPRREQRNAPLLMGLLSVIAGLTALIVLGAARQLLALIGAMIAGLVVSLLITQFWKISIHAGVAAGTVVILAIVFGPAGNAAWPLAAAIGWSRVELKDHTIAQVIGGSVIGAVVAGISFTVFS